MERDEHADSDNVRPAGEEAIAEGLAEALAAVDEVLEAVRPEA